MGFSNPDVPAPFGSVSPPRPPALSQSAPPTLTSADTHEFDQFLTRYDPARRPAGDRPPDLADSLAALALAPGLDATLGLLPSRVRCLIEGYAGPENASALRAFLACRGAVVDTLTAADINDVPAAYARLGLPAPDLRFIQADACDLSAHLAPASIDLLVQDFLLNCLPPVNAPRLLAEAARLLRPGGLAIISFTDDTGARQRPHFTPGELSSRWGLEWSPSATHLRDLNAPANRLPDLHAALAGGVLAAPPDPNLTFVTAPHGRFEFFAPAAHTRALLAAAGLDIRLTATETGRDDQGLVCMRHRCLAVRR